MVIPFAWRFAVSALDAAGGRVGSPGRCWLRPAVEEANETIGINHKHIYRPVVRHLLVAFRTLPLFCNRSRGFINPFIYIERTSGHRDAAIRSQGILGDTNSCAVGDVQQPPV